MGTAAPGATPPPASPPAASDPPRLTAYEASTLLSVLGDIDPAHFEGHLARYQAAHDRAVAKLHAIAGP